MRRESCACNLERSSWLCVFTATVFANRSVSGTCRPGQIDKQQLLESRGVTIHNFDPDNLQCLRYVHQMQRLPANSSH